MPMPRALELTVEIVGLAVFVGLLYIAVIFITMFIKKVTAHKKEEDQCED